MTGRLLLVTAFHEAGHAVARVYVGLGATDVVAWPDGSGISEGTGMFIADIPGFSRGQYGIWDLLIVLKAGPYAEARHQHSSRLWFRLQQTSDALEIEKLISELVGAGFADDCDAADRRSDWETAAFLKACWPTIKLVARALVDNGGRLSAVQVSELCADVSR